MIINSLMATLHHICAFTLTACLVYELVTFQKGISIKEAHRIQRADLIYGISAGLLIVVGFLRVFFFEKGAAFYLQNPIFWTKMGLFVTVGLLSIYPTIHFIRWNAVLTENKAPETPDDDFKKIRLLLWLEVTGIALIILVAPMMARGIGLN